LGCGDLGCEGPRQAWITGGGWLYGKKAVGGKGGSGGMWRYTRPPTVYRTPGLEVPAGSAFVVFPSLGQWRQWCGGAGGGWRWGGTDI
jgi:hypothetical protein